MIFPESIQPYVYKKGFDKMCEYDLQKKGVGAFAFVAVYDPDAFERNQRTLDKALAKNPFHSRYRNAVEANKILDRARKVGVAYYVNGGEIKINELTCHNLRNAGRTKDDAIRYLLGKRFPIDPQKMCDVAEMYRAVIT